MSIKKIHPDSNIINAPEFDYLYINPSQILNSGNGLFTAIDIYKDEIISVFKGEIILDKVSKQRKIEGNDSYFMNLGNGKTLDCMKTEGYAKYANDANGFYKSNFKNKAKIAYDDNNNVCLIALYHIKVGEEIFCSYGKKYWRNSFKPIL